MGRKTYDKMAMHSTTFLIAMKCQGELRDETPQYVQTFIRSGWDEERALAASGLPPMCYPADFSVILTVCKLLKGVVRPAGLEPATLCLEGRCSIHLSYGRTKTNSLRLFGCRDNGRRILHEQFDCLPLVLRAEMRVSLGQSQALPASKLLNCPLVGPFHDESAGERMP
jgi:hypothetical protein